MSPNARSLKWCRDHGIDAQVVERRVPRGWTTIDLLGCIDIVAMAEPHILGIQATTGAHHANRVAKAQANTRLIGWLACGARFEVWSWRQSMPSKRWVRRVAVARLELTPTGSIQFTEEET